MGVELLLAAESQLGALVQLVGVALPRDVHHQQVLPVVLNLSIWHGGDRLRLILEELLGVEVVNVIHS